jgi:hypothetical protein
MAHLYSPTIIVLWVLTSLIIGFLGTNRRLGFVGTFLVSLLFTPIIGLVVLLASDLRPRELRRRRERNSG